MNRKLRPPKLGTEGILGIISVTTFLILLAFSFPTAMAFGGFICLCAACISLVVIVRTQNMYFIPMFTGQLAAAIMMSIAAFPNVKEKLSLIMPFVIIMGASFTIMIIFTIQRKLKWRTREMLELAAQAVEEKTNGLTQRPLEAGKLDFSIEEIRTFADYIRKNLIAIPVWEDNRLVFILNIPTGKLLSFSKRYTDRTWVAFTFDGKIIVNIQQQDYFLYKDQLAFDKLCESLGKLFIEFFEDFRAGKEYLIMYRLNALNLNIITEG